MATKQSKESISGIGVADELLRKLSPDSTCVYSVTRGDVEMSIRRTSWRIRNYEVPFAEQFTPGAGVVITSSIGIPDARLYSEASEVVRRLNRPTDIQIRSKINRMYTSALREAALVRRRMDLHVEFEPVILDEAFLAAVEAEEEASGVTSTYALMSVSDTQHWSDWLSNRKLPNKNA